MVLYHSMYYEKLVWYCTILPFVCTVHSTYCTYGLFYLWYNTVWYGISKLYVMHTVQHQPVLYKLYCTDMLPDTVIIFGLFKYPKKKQTFRHASFFNQQYLYMTNYFHPFYLACCWLPQKRQT